MLTEIRKYSQSIVVKILFGVLIASFAAWGVGDMIRVVQSNVSAAVKVGDLEVAPADAAYQVRREIDRLRSTLGAQFGVQEAKTLGVIEAVLQRIANDTAMLAAAKSAGIAISDGLVANAVRKTAAFQGIGGFDRDQFRRVLNENEMTETWYLAEVRKQLARNQVLGSIALSTAPKSLVDAIYRRRQEKRVAEAVFISDKAQQGIPEPDAATLESYHKAHSARFTAPEYRTLTVIRLNADDLASEVAVTEAQIKDAYSAREDEFTVPETRKVEQMILAKREDAERAHKALSEGRTFAAVAKDVANMDANRIELGTVTRKDLLPELANVVFSLQKDKPSAPVKSPLGWHLFQVTEIHKGSKKTLEQVHDQVRKTIAHEKAVDSLYQIANKLDDQLGGGAPLEEAARQLNLKILKIAAIDAEGLDPTGKAVAGVPKGDFLSTAFSTDAGADSQIVETGRDEFFVLRVDKITPPALKPLDKVKNEVIEAWKADRRAEKSKKAAEAAVARVKGGASLDAVAKDLHLSMTTTPPLLRRPPADATTLPQALITGIFSVNVGEPTMARGDGGYHIAQVKRIIAADPAADKAGVEALADNLRDSIQSDIVSEFELALRDRYGVKINRSSVEDTLVGDVNRRAPARRR